MSRRQVFAQEIPKVIAGLDGGNGVALRTIYRAIAEGLPELVDDEVEVPPGHGLKWQHDVRWEIETLVGHNEIARRKDLGRGIYSVAH